MMFDLPARLVIAYGLIAFIALAAAALLWWWRRNSPEQRNVRERARTAERYRRRDEAAESGRALP